MKDTRERLLLLAFCALTYLWVQSPGATEPEIASRPSSPGHLPGPSTTRRFQDSTIDPVRQPKPCTGGVGAVIGLWILKGNKKHKPAFFLKRLVTVVRGMVSQRWNLTLVTDSDTVVNTATNAYQQSTLSLRVRKILLNELPYQKQAQSVDSACPTKYGKQLPKGSLATLDKVWLSKVWALSSTASEYGDRTSCMPASWVWFDAGLNSDEVRRAIKSMQTIKSPPNGSEIRLQFYPAGMRKPPLEYFKGRCPVEHTLNAKVIWATRESASLLLSAFNECLDKITQTTTCTCWDEETVLAHIHQRRAPCHNLKSNAPTFTHIDVYDKSKRVR